MKGTIYLMLLGVMLVGAGCSEQYEMRDFSPPDGSFHVSVPATPQHESRTLNMPQGASTLHSYSVIFDDVLFGINTMDLPDKVTDVKDPQQYRAMMAAGRDGMLAQNGWRLLTEVGDQINLSPSRPVFGTRITASTPGDTHTATVRIFILNGHGYQVIAVVPNKSSYNQEIYSVKFLESFKLKP